MVRTRARAAAREWGAALALMLGLLFPVLSVAQTIPPKRLPGAIVPPVTARSISGQFVVQSATGMAPRLGLIPEVATDVSEVALEAQWLAITAERVKRAVLMRFDAGDRWKGKIHLNIRPQAEVGPGPVRIVPVRFPAGLQYRVDLPDKMEWRRLIRALVEVVLLEMANRDSAENIGLPPLWMNEGMTALVLADQGRDLVPQSHTAVMRNERKASLLVEARKVLGDRPPLLFSELSFPADTVATDPVAWSFYQASSALLVHELMLDVPGRQAVWNFLALLPRYLNWQMAFLEAHRGRFLSVLEVEKWWAVNATHVLDRDPAQLWTREATLAHLASLLVESAEIGGGTNAPARREAVPLAELVLKWDGTLQGEVIRRKQEQVRDLYRHAPKEELPLVVDLNRILQEYRDGRAGIERDPARRADVEPRARLVAAKASRQLRELQGKIERLRNPPRLPLNLR